MSNKYSPEINDFAELKSKYKADSHQNDSPSSVLYLILQKANLGISLHHFEWNWLQNSDLNETVKCIKEEEKSRAREIQNLKNNYLDLRHKFQVSSNADQGDLESPLLFVLWKLDSKQELNSSELGFVKSLNLPDLIALIQEINDFSKLKKKYKADSYTNILPHPRLSKIFRKLDLSVQLTPKDIRFLENQGLLETLQIYHQQEKQKLDFLLGLKKKYKATQYTDSSLSSPLFEILQQLEAEDTLTTEQFAWLKAHELSETIIIAQEIEDRINFANLKTKYKATEYDDLSVSSHLYKVLKRIEEGKPLNSSDINFLKKRNLAYTMNFALDEYTETLKIKIETGEQLSDAENNWLTENEREDILSIAEEKHFSILKSKYHVSRYSEQSVSNPLYGILKKFEKKVRLDPKEIAWLQTNTVESKYYSHYWDKSGEISLFSVEEIFITFNEIEASFYEQEYKRTGNQWNLVNASSHWRKANQPNQALTQTENIQFDKVKQNSLKSALLTTRGGAFRDIHQLKNAEKCAKQAIEVQPKSHHPYTLMGAICFERYQYGEGVRWFEEAIKRGAKPQAQDAEIRQIVKKIKDKKKQQEFVKYLLKKDEDRYAWAKSYLSKSSRK